MVTTALLLGLLLVATFTDVRQRKIYNWTTYPGFLIALGLNGLGTLLEIDAASGTGADVRLYGLVGLPYSAGGFFLCGAVMLVCYVFFAGGVGGGDVKLVAMIGAFLGLEDGIEAMLWTFVLAGCVALISLVWRVGPVKLLVWVTRHALWILRLGKAATLTDEEKEQLKTQLFLSPNAVVAVVIVSFCS